MHCTNKRQGRKGWDSLLQEVAKHHTKVAKRGTRLLCQPPSKTLAQLPTQGKNKPTNTSTAKHEEIAKKKLLGICNGETIKTFRRMGGTHFALRFHVMQKKLQKK